MRPQGRTVEQEIARLANATHGVVTRTELLRAGVTLAEIKQRLRTGALLREHRGVTGSGIALRVWRRGISPRFERAVTARC
jgi:hypothetical protein